MRVWNVRFLMSVHNMERLIFAIVTYVRDHFRWNKLHHRTEFTISNIQLLCWLVSFFC